MIRVLSSACIVLLLLATGGKAWAGGKSPIAILGLEVYDNGSGIDPETTKAAKELTAALRDRARAGIGPYASVAAEKELIDEKLLNNCDTEAPTCMAAIGTQLVAEAVMYGKIEKSSLNGQPIYKVSIKLLNVNRKQLASSTVETLPIAEATGVRAAAHAKNWYGKLVGISTGGTVTIAANIDRGTVILDEEAKGTLASGKLTLNNIAEGRHTLAIEAPNYQRYEAGITVRNGETLQQPVTLVEMSKKTQTGGEGTATATSNTNIWKPVFYGTAVVDAGVAAYALYEWKLSRDNGNKIELAPRSPTDRYTEADCDAHRSEDSSLDKACSHYTKRTIGWVVTGVVGAAVVGSFYMAFIRNSDHTESRTASGGHRKRRELAITPIVTPEGGGATLRFDW